MARRRETFLEKLERHLATIDLEEIKRQSESIPEQEEPEGFANETPLITCALLEEEFVFLPYTDLSTPEITDSEYVPDDGIKTKTSIRRTEDVSRVLLIEDPPTELSGSPPTKVPRKEKTSFDAEVHGQGSPSNERNGSAAADEGEVGDLANEDVLEEVQNEERSDSESEDEYDEEAKKKWMPYLSKDEKKQLEEISEVTKFHSKLIDTRVKELHSKLKKEAEAHCLCIKQKAIDETIIFKRPSSVVVQEYHRTILMVMKYLDIQLKKVSSYQKTALKLVVKDFKKRARGVYDKVKKREQPYINSWYSSQERMKHVHNPAVFFFTFVIVLSAYAAWIISILNQLNENQ